MGGDRVTFVWSGRPIALAQAAPGHYLGSTFLPEDPLRMVRFARPPEEGARRANFATTIHRGWCRCQEKIVLPLVHSTILRAADYNPVHYHPKLVLPLV